jgi:hypothetical protein
LFWFNTSAEYNIIILHEDLMIFPHTTYISNCMFLLFPHFLISPFFYFPLIFCFDIQESLVRWPNDLKGTIYPYHYAWKIKKLFHAWRKILISFNQRYTNSFEHGVTSLFKKNMHIYIQGCENRIGPAGSTGWTGNRTCIRSEKI